MAKILIFGAHGLLGQNLVHQFSQKYDVYGVGIEPKGQFLVDKKMDYTRGDITDASQVTAIIEDHDYAGIINTAAYTNVDRAEDEPEKAFQLNAEAIQNILQVITDETPFVHISTDYIFDGLSGPYREEDPRAPQGVYAQTKFAGEQMVTGSNKHSIIVRPNVLYGHGEQLASSFVAWLVKELSAGRPVNIVDDQFNNPTYARRLAEVIEILVSKRAQGDWNFGSREVVNRLTFAHKIADIFGLNSELIHPISTEALAQRAPRPRKSGLVCDKIVAELNYDILPIHEELELLKREMYAG